MDDYKLIQACGDDYKPPNFPELEEILETGGFFHWGDGFYSRRTLSDSTGKNGSRKGQTLDYLLFDESGTSVFSLSDNEAAKFEKQINDFQGKHSKLPTALGAVLSTITGSLSFYLLDLYLFDTNPEIIQALFVGAGAVTGIFMQSLYTANPMLWRQNSIHQPIGLPPNVIIHHEKRIYDPDLIAYAITNNEIYLAKKPDDPIEAKPIPKTWMSS